MIFNFEGPSDSNIYKFLYVSSPIPDPKVDECFWHFNENKPLIWLFLETIFIIVWELWFSSFIRYVVIKNDILNNFILNIEKNIQFQH